MPDNGVVDENVDGAERLESRRRHSLDLRRLPQISAPEESSDVVAVFDLAPQCLHITRIGQPVEDDVAAARGEASGSGEAEGLGRSGDERTFAGERCHEGGAVYCRPSREDGMKRIRLVGVLLVLVAVVVAPIGAKGPHFNHFFNHFFVFGDSLSDTGNDFILSLALGAQPPLPPSVSPNRTYFNGRFSNGPVAFEYLWGRLNSGPPSLIPPSLADRRVPAHGAVSFAFGATGSGVSSEFRGVALPGLATQIELFRQSMRGKHAPPHSLFAVFTGANDYIVQPGEAPLNPVDVVNNIGRGITALYGLGARVIVVPNLADLGAIPLVGPGSPGAQLISQLVVFHNQLLALKLQTLSVQLPGIQLVPVDLHALTPPPGTNVTVPALDALVPPAPGGVPTSLCIFVNAAACPNVPTFAVSPAFFFWDAEHPTTAAHAFIGSYMQGVLQQALADENED